MTTSQTPSVRAYAFTDWRHRGACLGNDPELFFPVGTAGPAAAQARRAKRVCRGCPVMMECLDWALRSGQDCGVWGGLSEQERRDVLHARRVSRHLTPDGAAGPDGVAGGERPHAATMSPMISKAARPGSDDPQGSLR